MKKLLFTAALAALCAAQTGTRKGIDRTQLDPTCKACDDFYRYATGGWDDAHPIPADRARWGTFNELADANLERNRTILDAAAASGTGDVKRLGDFYSACMNTSAIEAAGLKPLQPEFAKIDAIASVGNLTAELISLSAEGPASPVTIGNTSDPDDSNREITGIGPAALSLPDRDYYFRDDDATKKIRDAFTGYVTAMSKLAGQSGDIAAATAKAVFDFESALAKSELTNVERRDPYKTKHKMTLAQVKELAPDFPWDAAFTALKIPAGVAINVSQPEHLKAFNAQLKAQPLTVWKTWLKWRLLNENAQYLPKAYYDEWFRFDQTAISGVAQQLPRWKICAAAADTTFGDALGKLYMDKYFPADSRARMSQLIVNMRAALAETLKNAEWLEPETRKNAVAKLDSFDPRIGSTTKSRAYSDVTVSRDGYLASKASATAANRRFNLAKIGKPVDRTEWSMTPPTVNAYYSSNRNSITFPAGILQPPFFDPEADDAINYGAIGAVIGHEMGHGFDDQGSKYDAQGNLKEWWTAADKANFEKRAACVTNQFETGIIENGLHHTGKLVTGEAMGDLGGLTLAYQAYHKSLNGKEAPVIDGFTGDQRFFLGFARIWAGSIRDAQMRRQLATDPHPLAKYRVNYTLQNMPEFHKAFNCTAGQPMVRAEQCKLW